MALLQEKLHFFHFSAPNIICIVWPELIHLILKSGCAHIRHVQSDKSMNILIILFLVALAVYAAVIFIFGAFLLTHAIVGRWQQTGTACHCHGD
jgi:hypothetical protein